MIRPGNKIWLLAIAPLLGVAFLLPGCSASFQQSEILGTYRATVSYGVATLVLNADGTYSQSFQYTSGRTVANSGRWQSDRTGENGFVLKNALSIGQNLGPPQYGLYRETNWHLQVESAWGKPVIEFGQGQVFHKV